jgi:FO synthase
MSDPTATAIDAARCGDQLTDTDALALADAGTEVLADLLRAAAAIRDRRWGRTVTYSPKVFLPLTNLCRNRCDYCSFRRSAGDPGEWTMTPDELGGWLDRAREQGCVEALFCLGDKPESSFPTYRKTLQTFGHDSTVDYLERASQMALERGLLPHTNASARACVNRECRITRRPTSVRPVE